MKAPIAASPALELVAGVAAVRPAVLKDRAAAQYLGISASGLRAKRLADSKACREGAAPTGPMWIVIGSSVFYRLADLDRWLAENAVERGVVSFSNRGGGAQP